MTGAAGFIGSQLLREMAATHEIVSVDLAHSADIGGHAWDIRESADESLLSGERFDTCIHLAAVAKEPGYPHEEYFRTNLLGTSHVLDLCDRLGVRHVVFTSTMMVYAAGEKRHSRFDTPDPDTAYGASKAMAELEVARWAARLPDRRATILRPGVVFGPNDVGNFERMRRALERRRFFYIGRKDTIKSSIHVDDVVGIIRHVCEEGSQASSSEQVVTAHVVFPDETSIERTVLAVCDAFGYSTRVPVVPYRPALAAAALVNIAQRGRGAGDIHPRRVQKLYRSTNIDASGVEELGYRLKHPTIELAAHAWAGIDGSEFDAQFSSACPTRPPAGGGRALRYHPPP